MTMFLYDKAPTCLPAHIVPRVKGLMLWGGGYHFNGGPMLPPPIMSTYFGTSDLAEIHKVSPQGLLEQAPQSTECLRVSDDFFICWYIKRTRK